MTVYIRNPIGQETIRKLPILQVLKLYLYQFIFLPNKNDRATIKILSFWR